MPHKAKLDGAVLSLELEKSTQASELIEEAVSRGALLIGVTEAPAPMASVNLKMKAPGGFDFETSARVLQILDQPEGPGVVLQLEGWSQSKELELKRKTATSAQASNMGEVEDGENQGHSPVFKLREMDPAEKMRLALKAGRAERRILCRDNSAQVLLGLLGNPRVDSTEVLAIVKSTHASPGVLQRVATDRRWSSNSEIAAAVVRNPKTPPPLAIKLLETLPIRELRDLAKMGSVRENVRRAAFRVYTKRSSRRG